MGWGFLMAAYYLALAYYALGPDRLAARLGPRLRRMRSGASSAGGAAVEWIKGINWVSCGTCWCGGEGSVGRCCAPGRCLLPAIASPPQAASLSSCPLLFRETRTGSWSFWRSTCRQAALFSAKVAWQFPHPHQINLSSISLITPASFSHFPPCRMLSTCQSARHLLLLVLHFLGCSGPCCMCPLSGSALRSSSQVPNFLLLISTLKFT